MKLAEWIRAQFLRRQFVRYVVVGVGNTLFAYLVYAAALFAGADYRLANLISLVLGILFSFTTQGRIVFGNATLETFIRFVLAWAAIYLYNIGVIALLMKVLPNAYLAGALATIPVTLISYFVLKMLVFARQTTPRQ